MPTSPRRIPCAGGPLPSRHLASIKAAAVPRALTVPLPASHQPSPFPQRPAHPTPLHSTPQLLPFTHSSHHGPRLPRRRHGVRPPGARRLRRGGGLPLPCPGARGGLRHPGHHPHRLPRLRPAGEHRKAAVRCLLCGGQDRRGQPRHRGLPLLPRRQQGPGHSHRHEARPGAPRRVRRVQRRLQQVQHFRAFPSRSTCTIIHRWGIVEWRGGRITTQSRGSQFSNDGDRSGGCRGGSPARLLLPLLRISVACLACYAAVQAVAE